MKPLHRTTLFACVFATLAVAALLTAEAAPTPRKDNAPIVVAIVDMARIFDESDQWADSRAKREKMVAAFALADDAYKHTLNTHELAVKDSPPGQRQEKAREDYMKMARTVQERRRKAETDVSKHFNQSYSDLFAKLTAACKAHAAANGIDLVLKHETSTDTPTASGVLDLHTSVVLFTSPHLDITDAITKALNDAWGQAAIEEN